MALQMCWRLSEPGCQIVKISSGRWSAVTGDKVAFRAHGVLPLPMGIEREDRCE